MGQMLTNNQVQALSPTVFQGSGREDRHGPDIPPDAATSEPADYRWVLRPDRTCKALSPRKHHLPAAKAALEPTQ
jgi:hypothetical protein